MEENILFPSTPLILVHRGWKTTPESTVSPKTRIDAENVLHSDSRNNGPQPNIKYQFVNSMGQSGPQKRAVNRMIRSQSIRVARQKMKTLKKEAETKTKTKSKENSIPTNIDNQTPSQKNISTNSIVPHSHNPSTNIPSSTTAFYGTPVRIRPEFSSLVNFYLYGTAFRLYPLESYLSENPVRNSWFPLAVTDTLMLHAILLASAAAIERESQTGEKMKQVLMDSVFKALQTRINSGHAMTDTTIAAVSCIAIMESSIGNYSTWRTHMTGIKEMCQTRGGISCIDPSIMIKIYRADIEGAIDSLTTPQLPFLSQLQFQSTALSDSAKFLGSGSPFLNFLWSNTSLLFPAQQATLISVHNFSRTLNINCSLRDTPASIRNRIHPHELDALILSHSHNLLAQISSSAAEADSPANRSMTLGTLIALKFLYRPPKSVRESSSVLIQEFQESLTTLLDGDSVFKTRTPNGILLWLFSIGAMAASLGAQQAWFMGRIGKCIQESIVDEDLLLHEYVGYLEDVKRKISEYGIVWVSVVHDKEWSLLWERLG